MRLLRPVRPALLVLGLSAAVAFFPAAEGLTRTPLEISSATHTRTRFDPVDVQDIHEPTEDVDIQEEVFTNLAACHIPIDTISVDVRNGVVTLHGTVSNPYQQAAAERAAQQVEGVKQVISELRVVPPRPQTRPQ